MLLIKNFLLSAYEGVLMVNIFAIYSDTTRSPHKHKILYDELSNEIKFTFQKIHDTFHRVSSSHLESFSALQPSFLHLLIFFLLPCHKISSLDCSPDEMAWTQPQFEGHHMCQFGCAMEDLSPLFVY